MPSYFNIMLFFCLSHIYGILDKNDCFVVYKDFSSPNFINSHFNGKLQVSELITSLDRNNKVLKSELRNYTITGAGKMVCETVAREEYEDKYCYKFDDSLISDEIHNSYKFEHFYSLNKLSFILLHEGSNLDTFVKFMYPEIVNTSTVGFPKSKEVNITANYRRNNLTKYYTKYFDNSGRLIQIRTSRSDSRGETIVTYQYSAEGKIKKVIVDNQYKVPKPYQSINVSIFKYKGNLLDTVETTHYTTLLDFNATKAIEEDFKPYLSGDYSSVDLIIIGKSIHIFKFHQTK